jgi:hypothetical protein
VFIVVSNAIGEIVLTGPPDSPITTEQAPVQIASRLEQPSVVNMIKSNTISGKAPVDVRISFITDEVELGFPIKNTVAWIASYRDVEIVNKSGKTSKVGLDVAYDVDNGEILLAYTHPRDEWVVPSLPIRDPEKEASKARWDVARAEPQSVSTDVIEVIQAIWNDIGLDPSEAGQIVLRPRIITCGFPRDPQTKKPLYVETPVWIVDVRGIELMNSGEKIDGVDAYFSGFLGLVDDSSKKLFRIRYMP